MTNEVVTLWIDTLETPLGTLDLVCETTGALRAIDWTTHRARMNRLLARYLRSLYKLELKSDPHGFASALRAYFGGDVTAIDGLPAAAFGTPFQRAVWSELRRVPSGGTRTYGQLARAIGHATAVRAVGLANGSNPISIVVPCHRVIGANGALTGYAGGLDRKQWLLRHESASHCD